MFSKECEYRQVKKLIVFIITNIAINILLYYFIEVNVINTTLKLFLVSFFMCLAITFTLIFTLMMERKNSCIDPLTGVYNRKKLYMDLAKLIRNKEKFELMFIDLNNFKEINDSFGHEAGDKMLEKFGEEASNLSNNIICYRIGGDEFILLSSQKKKSIESLDEFKRLSKFDFSHGISKFPEDVKEIGTIEEIIDKLMVIADKKMYKRKNIMKKL